MENSKNKLAKTLVAAAFAGMIGGLAVQHAYADDHGDEDHASDEAHKCGEEGEKGEKNGCEGKKSKKDKSECGGPEGCGN